MTTISTSSTGSRHPVRSVIAACFVLGAAALLIFFAVRMLMTPRVPPGRPLVADGAWKSTLEGPHPRLFGSADYLKSRALARPGLYQQLKNLDNSVLQASCIVEAVEGLPRDIRDRYVSKALALVGKGVTNKHQSTDIAVDQVAIIFDSFHDAFTPEDRKKIIDWLNAHVGVYIVDEGAFHNSTMAKTSVYLHVAYATWGENPMAKEFRDYAIEKLYEGRLVPVLRRFGAGGGYTECGWYSRYCVLDLVRALEMARRMEGYDGFRKAPAFFYQRLAYELYQSYPGLWPNGCERYAIEGDGRAIYSPSMEYPRETRMFLSQYFRGSELAGYASTRRTTTKYPTSLASDFVYEETPDAPRDLKDLPLAHIASGIGKVYARSDWGDNASWLRFECGDFFTQHQHFEAGNFEIFRRQPLAGESGVMDAWNSSYSLNWPIRTIAHNCILVFKPYQAPPPAPGDLPDVWTSQFSLGGQIRAIVTKNIQTYRRGQEWPPLMRDFRMRKVMANDGGQFTNTGKLAETLDKWMENRDYLHRGDIVAFQNRPEFMYVAGDYAAAYPQHKVTACTRQIVFIRPGTFVILDRVTAEKAEYPKAWLLHCHDEPQIDGRTVRIANGDGRLFVQTLLPEKVVVTKIYGSTYDNMTFTPGPSPDFGINRQAELAMDNLWRIEVRPTDLTAETVFLHVLSTDDHPTPAELVRKGERLGARGAGWEILFDSRLGATLTVGDKTFTLRDVVERGKFE